MKTILENVPLEKRSQAVNAYFSAYAGATLSDRELLIRERADLLETLLNAERERSALLLEILREWNQHLFRLEESRGLEPGSLRGAAGLRLVRASTLEEKSG